MLSGLLSAIYAVLLSAMFSVLRKAIYAVLMSAMFAVLRKAKQRTIGADRDRRQRLEATKQRLAESIQTIDSELARVSEWELGYRLSSELQVASS